MEMRKIVREIEVSSHQSQAWSMVDGNEDTCWFSGHGHKQCIDIYFDQAAYIGRIIICFQKEFHCIRGSGSLSMKEASLDVEMEYPGGLSEGCLAFEGHGDHIRIVLEESSDIYGRYCIYKVDAEL